MFTNQLIQFIAGLAILIFIHEMGHFIAARMFKVEVEEFGIGFPPRLFKLFEAGGTMFSLNAIPLGGFVRVKGENDPNVPGGLAAASPWVRLAVLFAGPMTNILLGVALSIILFYQLGEPIMDKVQIMGVATSSPAYIAGLQTGDIILRVDDVYVTSTDQLHEMIYDNLGLPIEIEVERQQTSYITTLTPRDPPPENEGAIGITMGYATQPTTWWRAIPQGVSASFSYSTAILYLPIGLVRGEIEPQEARPVGYKGMFDIYQQLSNPLWFFTMITMSLGVLNLFPIPALDGGRILLTLPEIIVHRRVPPHYENMIHLIGFAVLLILLIYINLQDFIHPVQLPF